MNLDYGDPSTGNIEFPADLYWRRCDIAEKFDVSCAPCCQPSAYHAQRKGVADPMSLFEPLVLKDWIVAVYAAVQSNCNRVPKNDFLGSLSRIYAIRYR